MDHLRDPALQGFAHICEPLEPMLQVISLTEQLLAPQIPPVGIGEIQDHNPVRSQRAFDVLLPSRWSYARLLKDSGALDTAIFLSRIVNYVAFFAFIATAKIGRTIFIECYREKMQLPAMICE